MWCLIVVPWCFGLAGQPLRDATASGIPVHASRSADKLSRSHRSFLQLIPYPIKTPHIIHPLLTHPITCAPLDDSHHTVRELTVVHVSDHGCLHMPYCRIQPEAATNFLNNTCASIGSSLQKQVTLHQASGRFQTTLQHFNASGFGGWCIEGGRWSASPLR